jgi:hypothetical protein
MASYDTLEHGVHPVPRTPALWKLKAEFYVLCCNMNKVPDGAYDPLEMSREMRSLERLRGVGCVTTVRYADTPVEKLTMEVYKSFSNLR